MPLSNARGEATAQSAAAAAILLAAAAAPAAGMSLSGDFLSGAAGLGGTGPAAARTGVTDTIIFRALEQPLVAGVPSLPRIDAPLTFRFDQNLQLGNSLEQALRSAVAGIPGAADLANATEFTADFDANIEVGVRLNAGVSLPTYSAQLLVDAGFAPPAPKSFRAGEAVNLAAGSVGRFASLSAVDAGIDASVSVIAAADVDLDLGIAPPLVPPAQTSFAFDLPRTEVEIVSVDGTKVRILDGLKDVNPWFSIYAAEGVEIDLAGFKGVEGDVEIILNVPTGAAIGFQGGFIDGPQIGISTGAAVGLGVDVGAFSIGNVRLDAQALDGFANPATPNTFELNGYSLSLSDRDEQFGISFDLDAIAPAFTLLPTFGGASLTAGPVGIDFDVWDIEMRLQSSWVHDVSMSPELMVRLDFSRPVGRELEFQVGALLRFRVQNAVSAESFAAFEADPIGWILNEDNLQSLDLTTRLLLRGSVTPEIEAAYRDGITLSYWEGRLSDVPEFLIHETTEVVPTYWLEGIVTAEQFLEFEPVLDVTLGAFQALLFSNDLLGLDPAFERTVRLPGAVAQIETYSRTSPLSGFEMAQGTAFVLEPCLRFQTVGGVDLCADEPEVLPGDGGSGIVDGGAEAVVPLPAGVWLLSAGLLALAGAARRRGRAV